MNNCGFFKIIFYLTKFIHNTKIKISLLILNDFLEILRINFFSFLLNIFTFMTYFFNSLKETSKKKVD